MADIGQLLGWGMRCVQVDFAVYSNHTLGVQIRRLGTPPDSECPELFEDLFLLANWSIRILSNASSENRSNDLAVCLGGLARHADELATCEFPIGIGPYDAKTSARISMELKYSENGAQLTNRHKGFSWFGNDLFDAEESSVLALARHLATSHPSDIEYLRRLASTMDLVAKCFFEGLIKLGNHAQLAMSIAGPVHVMDVGIGPEPELPIEASEVIPSATGAHLALPVAATEVAKVTEPVPYSVEMPDARPTSPWVADIRLAAIVMITVWTAMAIYYQSSASVARFRPSAAKQWRVWTSAGGTFSVEAKLQELRGRTVILKKRDDSIVRVPIEKLKVEDMRYVLSQGADGR